jgi:hypothetical protein
VRGGFEELISRFQNGLYFAVKLRECWVWWYVNGCRRVAHVLVSSRLFSGLKGRRRPRYCCLVTRVNCCKDSVRSENKQPLFCFHLQHPAGDRTTEKRNFYEHLLFAHVLCKLHEIKIIRKEWQIVVVVTFYFKTLCRLRKLSVVEQEMTGNVSVIYSTVA